MLPFHITKEILGLMGPMLFLPFYKSLSAVLKAFIVVPFANYLFLNELKSKVCTFYFRRGAEESAILKELS